MYNLPVRISYDPAKNAWNIRHRNLAFDAAAEFDFENALYAIDERQNYGETRYIALGLVRDRLHVLCFTETIDGIRVISFRKANDREIKRYAQAQITKRRQRRSEGTFGQGSEPIRFGA